MAEAYRTITGRAEAEIVEKKSRFIGQLAHVECESEALRFLEEIRATHRMAKHNVYAYILRGGRIRYSDDGEPAQTAGMPTLEALQHAGLEDVACVVTRYFGGVLLGTGGLVRAYTQATQEAIAAAEIVTVSLCVDVTLTVRYSLYDPVVRLAEAAGAKVVDTQFAENVTIQLRLLSGTEAPLVAQLTELTRGQSPVHVTEPYEAAF